MCRCVLPGPPTMCRCGEGPPQGGARRPPPPRQPPSAPRWAPPQAPPRPPAGQRCRAPRRPPAPPSPAPAPRRPPPPPAALDSKRAAAGAAPAPAATFWQQLRRLKGPQQVQRSLCSLCRGAGQQRRGGRPAEAVGNPEAPRPRPIPQADAAAGRAAASQQAPETQTQLPQPAGSRAGGRRRRLPPPLRAGRAAGGPAAPSRRRWRWRRSSHATASRCRPKRRCSGRCRRRHPQPALRDPQQIPAQARPPTGAAAPAARRSGL